MFLNISKGMQTLLTIWSTFFMVGRSVILAVRMSTPTAIIIAMGTTTRAAIRKLSIVSLQSSKFCFHCKGVRGICQ